MSPSAPYLAADELPLPTTIAEALVHKLGPLIVAGAAKPGESLGDESELLQRYGVSRSVLRDAFKILAGKGMIETRRGVGTQIRPRSDWMMLDRDVLAWHQSAGDDQAYLPQLLQVRRAIEPLAASLAAQAEEAQRGQIMEAYRGMEAAATSQQDFVHADTLFHRELLHASGNIYLMAMEGLVFSALAQQIKMINRTVKENTNSLPLHLAVAEAVVAGKPEQAEKSMRTLLNDARERLDKALAED
ncbi:MAG: FadR family transcriptional regulator [Betaproteobacteria bacterium AqS2]|uniref:FadR family transcriptional regulator n=1 Tax=Candidatus Amphirhobacter heronislandensis TaxID=1732024 RepID=A0A930UGR8_9GAMM|nr:FadR family transcriptional regulator [Betaproteobacteria bacterium AqS2]